MGSVVWDDLVIPTGLHVFDINLDNFFASVFVMGSDGFEFSPVAPSLINLGEVRINYSTLVRDYAFAIFPQGLDWTASAFENWGFFNFNLPNADGVVPFRAEFTGPTLENHGVIEVTARYNAGCYSGAGRLGLHNFEDASIVIRGSEQVYAVLARQGGTFVNEGDISVVASGVPRSGVAASAMGFAVGFGGGFGFDLDNSGSIVVDDNAPNSPYAYAIRLGGDALATIVNTGLISSPDFAIYEHDTNAFGTYASIVTNLGTIIGDIVLEYGADTIINSGHIEGNIALGPNGDRYDGTGGTMVGSVSGDDGNDWLTGGTLADALYGDAGNDLLEGLAGDDYLFGGAGNDTLDGGAGLDRMYGGVGDDTYIVSDATDYAYENVGEGYDRVLSAISLTLRANVEELVLSGTGTLYGKGNELDNVITGNAWSNKLYGLDGNDTLYGGLGNDQLTGGNGADQLYGGVGNDFYYITDANDTVHENVGEGTDRVYASIDYVLDTNVEYLILTGTANLTGSGNAAANSVYGNDGDNWLYGLGGDDRLYGADGNDHLDGGVGGFDRMWGGYGDDVYYIHDATDYAYEFADQGHDLVYSDVSQNLRLYVEDLVLTGTADNYAKGNVGDNGLTGNSGANKLYGLAGNDTLDGGAGNDWLEGGAGQDLVTGGSGADDFVFRDGDFAGMTAGTADRILDFSQAEGDRIRLNIVDANTTLGGDQAFSFIGTTAFHGIAGELRYEQLGGNTYVMGDTNGDGNADFWIRLDGLHTLGTGDFVF